MTKTYCDVCGEEMQRNKSDAPLNGVEVLVNESQVAGLAVVSITLYEWVNDVCNACLHTGLRRGLHAYFCGTDPTP